MTTRPTHEEILEAERHFGVSYVEAYAILTGEEPPPDTLAEAGRDLREATHGCALSLAYALRLDRLATWLSRAIRRIAP